MQQFAVPPAQRVAARHVLIRYAGAEVTADAYRHATRTREAARQLAESVAAKARARPEAFVQLVHDDSEDIDPEDPTDDGDIGVWSIHAGASSALVTYLLSQLPVGGISAVVETRAGFEVFQRSAATEREQLAARYVRFEQEDTSGVSQALARTLSQSPERFEAVTAERCASGACAVEYVAWEKGRARHRVDRLVSNLQIGGVSPEPIRVGAELRIYQRLVAQAPPPEPSFETELPAVDMPSADSVIARFDGRSLAAGTRGLLAQTQPALDLDPEQRQRFGQVLEELALSFERADESERPSLLQRSRTQLLAVLGPAKFEKFQRMRDARLRGYLLQ